MQQKILLDYTINSGLRLDKKMQERLQAKFGAARSNKTKAKNRLNESLKRFSESYKIAPLIQLYFESSELRKRVTHFACCNNQGETESSSYFDLTKLKEMLGEASQLLDGVDGQAALMTGRLVAEPAGETHLSVVFDDVTQALINTKDQKVPPDPAYYLGTNADWRHIKAGQDVVRNDLMAEIPGHFSSKNICVILSESGQGKSTLMYRFAFDNQNKFYILELRYLNSKLVRMTELALKRLATLSEKNILILADDLTEFCHWGLLLKSLKRIKNVYVLATARKEKWDTSNIRGLEDSIGFVEPKLEKSTAELIFEQLKERRLVKASTEDWATIFSKSEGRLLEYVTLLTQGNRLKDILSIQLAKKPVDELDVLRIISTVHTLGYSADFSLLENSLELPPQRLAVCLENLTGEFIKKTTVVTRVCMN
jgi:hypothetical protein